MATGIPALKLFCKGSFCFSWYVLLSLFILRIVWCVHLGLSILDGRKVGEEGDGF